MTIRKIFILFLASAFVLTLPALAPAADDSAGVSETATVQAGEKGKKLPCVSHKPEEKPTCAAPPLPPHSIEGPGGIFITHIAYLVNPGQHSPVGMPTFGLSYANLEKKDFMAATFSETLFNRIELSYAFNNLQLGDLRRDIKDMTGLDTGSNHVQMHNFNLRVNLVPEGSFGLNWMPALTAGVHFKKNEDVDSIDKHLGGVLSTLGVDDDHGIDYTLVATKMISGVFPRPLLLTAGMRMTKACHIGLLGFSDHYSTQVELSFAQFLTDRLLIVGEFRSKPDKLDELPGMVEEEDDWWTMAFCYILNNHSTMALGYFHPGMLLNEDVNNGWATRLMWEF